MFWIFLLAIGGVVAFVTIGAQSVWLKIFGLGFKVLGVLVSVAAIWFVWRYLSERIKLAQKAIGQGDRDR